MSKGVIYLDHDAEERLKQWLRNIRAALASSGATNSDQAAVTEEYHSQVYTMLEEREVVSPVGSADLDRVLADIDVPALPIAGPASSAPAAVRIVKLSRLAVLGLAWGGLIFVLVPIFTAVSVPATTALSAPPPSVFMRLLAIVFSIVGASAPFGMIALGIAAYSQILRYRDLYYGTALAIIDMLFYPWAVGSILILRYSRQIIVQLFLSQVVPSNSLVVILMVANATLVLLWTAMMVYISGKLWRFARRGTGQP